MPRKPTKREVEIDEARARAEDENRLLNWWIATLPIPDGFTFIGSPRGYQGAIVQVTSENGHPDVTVYRSLVGATKVRDRNRVLYDAHGDGPLAESLAKAVADERRYLASLGEHAA